MGLEFNAIQRKTLTAIVDTFVAAVPREDDPTGFYAAKGSDVGADVAAEHYLVTRLPEEQLAGLLQLIDTAGLVGLKNQPQAVREAIIANLAGISPETAGAIAALYQLSVCSPTACPAPRAATPCGPAWAIRAWSRPRRRRPRHLTSSPRPARRRSRRMWWWSARAAAAGWPPRCWRRPASG